MIWLTSLVPELMQLVKNSTNMLSTGMTKGCQCLVVSLNLHVQVLWHTAAAFSEKLLQAAQLPGEKLAEQAAELTAERLIRQQQAIPVPPQNEEPDAGQYLSPAT